MASKSSIPLFSKAAREVLSHSQLTVLGSGGDDGDTAMSEYTTGSHNVARLTVTTGMYSIVPQYILHINVHMSTYCAINLCILSQIHRQCPLV